MKQCSNDECHKGEELQPLNNFYNNASSSTGRSTRCIACLTNRRLEIDKEFRKRKELPVVSQWLIREMLAHEYQKLLEAEERIGEMWWRAGGRDAQQYREIYVDECRSAMGKIEDMIDIRS